METGKRVFWNDDEKSKLADEVFRLIQKDPTGAIVATIEQAQESVFEPDRHRNCAIQGLPWMEEELMTRFRQLNEQGASKDRKIEKLEEKISGFSEQLEKVPTRDELQEESIDEMDSTELLVRFIQKQGDEKNALLFRLERIEGFIFNKLAGLLTTNGKATLTPPDRKKLVFVGFGEHEVAATKLDFAKYADLVFVAPSMPMHNYPSEPGQVFISRKGTSSSLVEKLRSSKYGNVTDVIDGGIAKIKKALWSYLNQ